MARDYGYSNINANHWAGMYADRNMESFLKSKGRDTTHFKEFYNQYTDWGNKPDNRWDTTAAFTERRKSQFNNVTAGFLSDYDKFLKHKDNQKEPVAESTIRAESTTSAQKAAQTGVPSIDNMSTESDKDTETKRRRNKARGKRGFVVARESGQGINI